MTERQRIAEARIALIGELRKTHQKLAGKMIPIADDVAFTLTMALETAADGEDPATIHKTLMGLADNELGALQAVLALRAESNLTLGILVEAADLATADLLPPVKDRFMATANRIGKAAAILKDAETTALVGQLVAIGRGQDNIFDLKQKEIAATKAGMNVVAENRVLQPSLKRKYPDLVSAARPRPQARCTPRRRKSAKAGWCWSLSLLRACSPHC